MLIIWYINMQATSSSKTRCHVDSQVRSNAALCIYIYIYIYMQVVRIYVYACKYVYIDG